MNLSLRIRLEMSTRRNFQLRKTKLMSVKWTRSISKHWKKLMKNPFNHLKQSNRKSSECIQNSWCLQRFSQDSDKKENTYNPMDFHLSCNQKHRMVSTQVEQIELPRNLFNLWSNNQSIYRTLASFWLQLLRTCQSRNPILYILTSCVHREDIKLTIAQILSTWPDGVKCLLRLWFLNLINRHIAPPNLELQVKVRKTL